MNGLIPISDLTEAHAVRTIFSYSLATARESACVIADMDTATEGAAPPGAPSEVPVPALFPEQTASKNEDGTKDHIDRTVHDTSVADFSEQNAIASTLTADAVNGIGDGTFTHDPMPLTDEHQVDSGYTSGTNGSSDDIWSPATKLKRRLEDTQDLIVCPGVYDGFSARIALSVGFDAIYMVRLLSMLSLGQLRRKLGLTAS